MIDTNGVTPAVFVIDGLRATENTGFHERIARNGDTIADQITVTDPSLFTEPYVITDSYTLKPDWEMREYVCQENNDDAADEKGRASMSLKDPFADLDKP